MLQKLTLVGAAIVLVLGLVVVGIFAVFSSIESDMFSAGPTSAVFVDRAVGTRDPGTLGLVGDVLLTSQHMAGLTARPLSDLSKGPLRLFPAVSVTGIAPGGAYVSAWTGTLTQVVRLSDLHAVAEIEGADPFFIDADRILVVFHEDGCRRGDAAILDLRTRTQRQIELSGDKAGLAPLAIDGDEIVALRNEPGDSGCASVGFARVDLPTGAIKTIATSGTVSAVTPTHVWVNDFDQMRVFTRRGTLVGTTKSVVTAAAVGDRVAYAELPSGFRADSKPDPPTRLRLGAPTGPRTDDAAGDELLEPEQMTVIQDGAAVLVAHRGREFPNGGHATVLSRCSLPDLRCENLLDVTQDIPRVLGIVRAEVFSA